LQQTDRVRRVGCGGKTRGGPRCRQPVTTSSSNGLYKLTADGDGTGLDFEFEATVGGVKRLFASMVQKTMDQEVAAIERLTALLESS
jgi:hypothetical protein